MSSGYVYLPITDKIVARARARSYDDGGRYLYEF